MLLSKSESSYLFNFTNHPYFFSCKANKIHLKSSPISNKMQGTSRESVYLPLYYYSHHFKTRYINWAGGEYQWQGVLIAYYSVKSQYKLEYVINQGLERKVECKEVPDNSTSQLLISEHCCKLEQIQAWHNSCSNFHHWIFFIGKLNT